MRVLLAAAGFYTWPDRVEHWNTTANLGLYLIAAIAEQVGHEVTVIDPSRHPSRLPFDQFQSLFSGYDAYAFSSTTSTWPETIRLLKQVRETAAGAPIILGGPHTTLFDEHVLRRGLVDYAVRGEGEVSFIELLHALSKGRDPQGIAGVSCLRDEKLVRGKDRELLSETDMASLPLPRYDLIPTGFYRGLPVETSRGCRHRCVFCSITHPRTWRDMGEDRLSKTLNITGKLVEGYTGKSIHIIDDCFLAAGRDLAALERALTGVTHPLTISTRVSDLLDPRALETYSRLPIDVCELGVECGYDEGISKVGKGVTLAQVRDLARLLGERGLIDKVYFSYVIGFPWEGIEECLATVQFAFSLAREYGGRILLGWFMLYPGSEIYLHQQRYGIEMDDETYDTPLFWRDPGIFARMHPRLSDDDIDRIKYTAHFLKRMHDKLKVYLWM